MFCFKSKYCQLFVIIGLVFAVLTALAPTLTIHANRGGDGSSSSSGGSGFGHAWFTLDRGEGNITAHETRKPGWGEPVNEDTSSDSQSSFEITDSQAEQIEQYAQNETGDYEFFDNNCTDFIEGVLEILGVENPSFDTVGISDPEKLANWLDSNPGGKSADLAPSYFSFKDAYLIKTHNG